MSIHRKLLKAIGAFVLISLLPALCWGQGATTPLPTNLYSTPGGIPSSPTPTGGANCSDCLSPAAYGVKANGVQYSDATWSSGGPSFTISGTDAPLTSAQNGQACYGFPNASGHLATLGTFTYVSATSGTCTSLLNTAAGNGLLRIATNDTAAWVSLMAACFAQQNGCSIVPPIGNSILQQCPNSNSSLHANNFFINVFGQGSTGLGSTIWPAPGFTFSATASTANIPGLGTVNIGSSATGCFFTKGPGVYQNFSIDGGGETMSGVSNALNPLVAFGNGSVCSILNIYNFDTAGTNFNGGGTVQLNGNFAYCQGLFITNVGDGNISAGGGAGPVACYNCGTGVGTFVALGEVNDFFGSYSSLYVNVGPFHGNGTTINGQVAQNHQANADCDHCVVNNSGVAGNVGWLFNTFNGSGTGNQTLELKNSRINGGATGGAFSSQSAGFGTVIDDVNNSFTGALTPFTGTYIAPGGGSMATQNVSATTNFGTNLTTQTVIPATGPLGKTNVKLLIGARQVTAGVSCGAGSNTVFATVSYTAPGGTVTTVATTTLSISANGAVDSGANAEQTLDLPLKQGTAVTYTTTSALASTGCSPVPQYVIDAAVN